MKWTCEEILDHAEELADRFEAFDPAKAQEVPAAEYLLVRAARGQDCCDEHLVQALRAAREQGTSWERIGAILGITSQQAQRLGAASIDAPQVVVPSSRAWPQRSPASTTSTLHTSTDPGPHAS